MKCYRLLLAALFAFFFSACEPSNSEKADDYTYFVTRLGNDTLAIERFKDSGNEFIAHVVLRSPRTRLLGYSLTRNESGGIQQLTEYQPEDTGFQATEELVTQTVRVSGDSLVSEVRANNGDLRTFSMLNQLGALPFIDMVHWPFELAFKNAKRADTDSVHQMLLTGRRLSDFIVHKMNPDSLTLRHPSRGVMGVTVGDEGELRRLDAALTTRKLVVTRVNSLDFEKIAASFVSRDKNGSPFGALSGAVEEDFSFSGADFKVSYGSPQKRGREIFGGIVSWGTRWRTGANRATHFSTSRDLKIGELKIPAGEYTLFTIPEPDGGTLIINQQTGQNGQSYDQSRDLGRVPMTIGTQDEVTESFTILVEEKASGGVLKLIWDQTVFSVDFAFD